MALRIDRENNRLDRANDTDLATIKHEVRFMRLMDGLLRNFEKDDSKTVEIWYHELCRHLAKVDPDLVTPTTDMITRWKMDKSEIQKEKEPEEKPKKQEENQLKQQEKKQLKQQKEKQLEQQREQHQKRKALMIEDVIWKSVAGRGQTNSAITEHASSRAFPGTVAAQNNINKPSASRTDKCNPLKRSENTEDVPAELSARPQSDISDIVQQQPSEANDYGLVTPDGVLVGRPPNFHVGLLDWGNHEDNDDWEDTDDFDDMQEIVARRQARAISRTSDQQARGAMERDDLEPEEDWVVLK